MKKNWQIANLLLLVLGLIFILNACGESSSPATKTLEFNLSSVKTLQLALPSVKTLEFARNYQDGTTSDVTATFSADEPVIYAVATLGGQTSGLVVKMVWMQADAGGLKEEKITEAAITLTENQNVASNKFVPAGPLPTGKYRVDVFLNEVKTQSAEFNIV